MKCRYSVAILRATGKMVTELADRNERTAVKENCFTPTCLTYATVIMSTGCAWRYLDRLNSSHSYDFDETPDSSEEIGAWENPKTNAFQKTCLYLSFLNKYNARREQNFYP